MIKYNSTAWQVIGLITAAFWASTVQAGGAHVHGRASMTVVLDGTVMHIQATIAAHDVLGFERSPSSEEERQRVASVVTALQASDQWLSFDSGECSKQRGMVYNPFDLDQQTHSADHTGHHDFTIDLTYACQGPDELTAIQVKLNEPFAAIEHIEVQWLAHDQQGLTELSGTDNEVRLKR